MEYNNSLLKMNDLFLQQSYLDAWEDYERSINKLNFYRWDYCVLTASNEEQAQTYREQIRRRREDNLLPEKCHYAVLSDPEGKRVGSGGATFNVLRYIAEQERLTGGGQKPGGGQAAAGSQAVVGSKPVNPFKGKRILVIHSGGDSKRVPQYSAVGKLFSPVPRELPDGRNSTLFDELIIGMSGVPSRIQEGMLVLSGDVLLLFNPLQIDAVSHGAMAISIKEKADIGKDHGVYLNDGHNYVGQFLHKQSEERLREAGAVNDKGCVDLDTGAVLFGSDLLMSLFGLISTDGENDAEKFEEFVNERARISFYGDFLYPLAGAATLEQYYREAAEGEINEELLSCRTRLWEALHEYSIKLMSFSPAKFIHFGTTAELRSLVTAEVEEYAFLGWKKQTNSTGGETVGREIKSTGGGEVAGSEPHFTVGEAAGHDAKSTGGETAGRGLNSTGGRAAQYAAYNSYVGRSAVCGKGSYIESSYVLGSSVVGEGAVVSGVHLRDANVPGDTVWHGLKLRDGSYVIRCYHVEDNPKGRMEKGAAFHGTSLRQFMVRNSILAKELWDDEEDYLWFARLYPKCGSWEDAQEMAALVGRMAAGEASPAEVSVWRSRERTSLYESFNQADTRAYDIFCRELESRILANRFVEMLSKGVFYKDALGIFGRKGITENVFRELLMDADAAPVPLKVRIYYALFRAMQSRELTLCGMTYDILEAKCFGTIEQTIYDDAVKNLPDNRNFRICKDHVSVSLPVRVNWGGGWTDTPPQCNEEGGAVLNAAITLGGIKPIQVTVRRLEELKVEFESQDVGARGEAHSTWEVCDCHNPYDSFALHKAALIACGVIPLKGEEQLEDVLRRLGGGIYLSTQAVGIPKGSGLGTSSILSAACVKAIYEFLGLDTGDDRLAQTVLCMEQIMSTGGGWQDQVGGLTEGIKFIRSKPGIRQQLTIDHVELSSKTRQELQERFALIYTGQRRLARNLLRDVVGNYIGARPESVEALKEMKHLAALMRFELEEGNIDAFAELLNRHWECSKKLDGGATNTCIEQIFKVCENLICGRFIAGAGGGGFLQVILKKGITREELHRQLYDVFQDSGIDVWDCEILF